MIKLYRYTEEGFDVDPVLIRIGFVCSVLFLGIGLLPYILLAIIIPENPKLL